MAQYPTRNINDIDDLSRQTMNNKNNVAYERANRIFPTSWRGIHDGWISKPRTSPRFPPRLPRKCNTKL